MPQLRGSEPTSDFHFVERDEPEAIAATLVRLAQERIPKRLGFDPIGHAALYAFAAESDLHQDHAGPSPSPRQHLRMACSKATGKFLTASC